MKSILLLFALMATATTLPAQVATVPSAGVQAPPKIGTLDATNYIDKEMTVTGRVVQVTVRPAVTFLNLDKPFPDSPFTVVIFRAHSQFLGDPELFKGHAIEVRGKIKNFKDKPEIALDNTNQLVVIGMTNLSVFVTPVTAPASTPAATNAPPANQATNFPEIM